MMSARQLSQFFVKTKKITNVNFQKIRNMSSTSLREFNVEERKIKVDGIFINYLRTGVGGHPVLLMPGSMGTIWTDFKPQIEKLDKQKLTIVAWDPPGYGKSRPPDRNFSGNFFEKDASMAFNLMKTLGYNKFSLVGWSDGGITSFFIAAQYPENIRKMVVTGANAYICPGEMLLYEKIRNIDTWSEKMRKPLVDVYGDKYFRETWSNWVDAMKNIYEKNNGDICKGHLSKIKCPSLIVHGEKDAVVFREHPDYLQANIANSRVEIFKAGAHNLHLRYADEFNALVNKFLTE